MFHNYPYTDAHELNLDWIIGKIKHIDDTMKETEEFMEAAQAAQTGAETAQENAETAQGKAEDAQEAAETAQGKAEDAQEASENAQEAAEQAVTDARDVVSNTLNQIELLQSRVDNIIPEGTQTAGNTELLDIRVGYNGVIYDSAGNAVRGQVSDIHDLIDQIYSGEIPYGQSVTYNYSDLPVFRDGYYINNSGVLQPQTIITTSVVQIPTTAIKKITLTATADQSEFAMNYIHFMLNGSSYHGALEGEHMVGGEDYYITLDRNTFDYNAVLLMNWLGRSGETYEMNDSITIEYFTREEWEKVCTFENFSILPYKVYFSAAKLYESGKYMTENGAVTSAKSNIRRVNARDVDVITITMDPGHDNYPSSSTPLCVLADSDGNALLEMHPSHDGVYVYDVSDYANKDTLYVNEFNTNTWYKSWKSSFNNDVFVPDYIELTKKKPEFNFRNYIRRPFTFTGATVEFIGDSITEGVINTNPIVYTLNTWVKLFCDKVGITTYTNRAEAGACYYDATNPGVKSMLEQLQRITDDPDIIFIAGGTNDWLLGTSEANFKTAVDDVLTYINTNFSDAVVIFITPINQAGWNGSPSLRNVASLQRYRNIISEEVIANDVNGKFSVVQGGNFDFPTADCDAAYISAMFGDRLHPTELGYSTAYLAGIEQALL